MFFFLLDGQIFHIYFNMCLLGRLFRLGGHHSISRGGGGVESRTNYLFQTGSVALKILNFITCLYRTVFGVNY